MRPLLLLASLLIPNGIVKPTQQTASLNANGRFQVFSSSDPLVPLANKGIMQVYLRDRISNELTLLSGDSQGNPGDAHSYSPDISHDGRYVSFLSNASNLSANKAPLYIYDQGLQELVGVDLDLEIQTARISGNGEALALIANDKGYYYHFRHHLLRQVERDGNGTTSQVAINYDGTMMAFTSTSTNLVDDIVFYAGFKQVYLYQVISNSISLVSRGPEQFGPLGDCLSPAFDYTSLYYLTSATNIGDEGAKIVRNDLLSFTENVIMIPSDYQEPTHLSVALNGRLLISSNNSTTLVSYDLFQKLFRPLVSGQPFRHPTISGDGRHYSYYSDDQLITKSVDTQPPVINYQGEAEIVVGTSYDPLAHLSIDEGVSWYLVSDSQFDCQIIGEYLFTVEAIDRDGNATIFSFTVSILPAQYPLYLGPRRTSIRVNSELGELMERFRFVDQEGKSLPAYLVERNFDLTSLGRYFAKVGAKNDLGLETVVEVEINVVATVIGDLSYLTFLVIPLVLAGLSWLIVRVRKAPRPSPKPASVHSFFRSYQRHKKTP